MRANLTYQIDSLTQFWICSDKNCSTGFQGKQSRGHPRRQGKDNSGPVNWTSLQAEAEDLHLWLFNVQY